MNVAAAQITEIRVDDVRAPTSDSLLGSESIPPKTGLLGGRRADFDRHRARGLVHRQLRWLGESVFRMVLGGLVNAPWDVWAKLESKPLWTLLVDLPVKTALSSIDWRYLRNVLTRSALSPLKGVVSDALN